MEQEAAVGVELAAGLERDGVEPALGIGELDPLTGLEGPATVVGTAGGGARCSFTHGSTV